MEPEGSLPHLQASATCPYPGPAQSSSHRVIAPLILTLAIDGDLVVKFDARPQEREPGTHCIGGFMGPRAGLDGVQNGRNVLTLPVIELRFLSFPPGSLVTPSTELPRLQQ